MKKPFESKAKRLYSIFASVFFMLAVFVVPAFAADGDPLAVVNNLSDFIFSLIRAVGLILLGFGILQVGLSLKSHDPSQRKRHSDCCGRYRHYVHQGDPDADHRLITPWGERECSPRYNWR